MFFLHGQEEFSKVEAGVFHRRKSGEVGQNMKFLRKKLERRTG
jgi:hypothetical protein